MATIFWSRPIEQSELQYATSNAYSHPKHFSHAHSKVYSNSSFGRGNRGNHQSSPCDNSGPQLHDQQAQFITVNDWFMSSPEFPKFDSNFINGFEKHIESKIRVNKLLLCYLIQYSENTVKEKIKHFTNKGDLEYQLVILDSHRSMSGLA